MRFHDKVKTDKMARTQSRRPAPFPLVVQGSACHLQMRGICDICRVYRGHYLV